MTVARWPRHAITLAILDPFSRPPLTSWPGQVKTLQATEVRTEEGAAGVARYGAEANVPRNSTSVVTWHATMSTSFSYLKEMASQGCSLIFPIGTQAVVALQVARAVV